MVYNITSLMMNINSTLLHEAEVVEGACTRLVKFINVEVVSGLYNTYI